MARNQWADAIGTGGRIKSVRVGGSPRNTHTTFGAVVEDYIRLSVIGPDEGNPYQRKGLKVARELREEFVHGRVNGIKVRSSWAKRPIESITPKDVLRVTDDAVARGAPYQAHNLLGHIRTMFNWAIARGEYGIDVSPTDRMRPRQVIGKKALRVRVLTDQELFALWHGAENLSYPYGSLFQLLALTGQRKSEVAEACWSEFNLKQKIWTIPAERMKADAPHVVPLSDFAIAILQSLPTFSEGDYLFTTTFGLKAVNGFSKAKSRLNVKMSEILIAEEAGELEPFVIHDIRRTVRTRLSGLSISTDVAELVIAHSKPGLRRVYDQFSYLDEKRQALDLWAGEIIHITNR